jgi:hypothetical protein
MQQDLTLTKLEAWFYQSDNKCLYRIRRPEQTKGCLYSNDEGMTKADAFQKMLSDWANLNEGTYVVEMKKSTNGGWDCMEYFQKGTPSATAQGVINGIGMVQGGYGSNVAFEFMTTQMTLMQNQVNSLRDEVSRERELRRDAEQKLLVSSIKSKKNKGGFDKLLSAKGVAAIGSAVASIRGGIRPTAIAGTEVVDATISPEINASEKAPDGQDQPTIAQKRYIQNVLMTVQGLQDLCPNTNILALLQQLEESAAANTQGFEEKIKMALNFL